MKSVITPPRRMVLWKCPDCNTEKETFEKTYPWFFFRVPLFSGNIKTPLCPKCRKKMIRVKLYY